MFRTALAFNQNVNAWDVSNVTSMYFMFDSASSFNQNLNYWDVSNVKTTSGMFWDAEEFNQCLSAWPNSIPENGTTETEYGTMFKGAACPNISSAVGVNSW